MLDVGITHYYRGGVSGGDDKGKPICATRMAKSKIANFRKNVLGHVVGAGRTLADSWTFVPLCADSAGGWADEAIQTMHRCASRIDIA